MNRDALVFCTSQLIGVSMCANAIRQAMHAQQHTCDLMHVQYVTQHCFTCADVTKLLRAKRWSYGIIASHKKIADCLQDKMHMRA